METEHSAESAAPCPMCGKPRSVIKVGTKNPADLEARRVQLEGWGYCTRPHWCETEYPIDE